MSQSWRDRPERGGRRITRFYIWLCLTIGRRLARPILYGIAFYFFASAPVERRHSADYLRRVTGRRASLYAVYSHFFTFSTVIMDRLFFLARREEHLSFEFHGVEVFHALRRTGQGFFLASGHLGSFEAMRVLGISGEGQPIKVLMFMENARQLNELVEGINPKVARSVISLGRPGAMLEVKEWIGQGGVVGILADRGIHGEKVTRVEFLGSPANFPLGPWLLAGALEAPVVLCFALYRGRGHYDIYFELLSEKVTFRHANRIEVAERVAADYARRLAHFCRMAPYNWFNFFDFWAQTEPAHGPIDTPAA